MLLAHFFASAAFQPLSRYATTDRNILPCNPSGFFLDQEEHGIANVGRCSGSVLSLCEVNLWLHHLVDEFGGDNVCENGARQNRVDGDALASAELYRAVSMRLWALKLGWQG